MTYWNKGFLLIGCLVTMIAFQNCVQSSPVSFGDSASKASTDGDGQPFDGKVYLLLGATCPDQTNIQTKILLKTFTTATLVREKCQDIAPIELSGNDFQLNPANSDQMTFQSQVLYAIAPTQVIGTKVELAIATSDGGFAYIVDGNFGTPASNLTFQTQSKLQLLEDGIALGPAHSLHEDIRNIGRGRYSHWDRLGEALRFSASDNSDPRTNGRIYSYQIMP